MDTVVHNSATDDMRSAASWVFHPISKETKDANKDRSALATSTDGPGHLAPQQEEERRHSNDDGAFGGQDEDGDTFLTTFSVDEALRESKRKKMTRASSMAAQVHESQDDGRLHRTQSTPAKNANGRNGKLQVQETSFFARQPSPILPRSGLTTPQDSPGKRVPRMSTSSNVILSPYLDMQGKFNSSRSQLLSSPIQSAVHSASQSPQLSPARVPSPYAAEETLRQYEQLREERQRILRQRGEAFEAIWKQARWTGKESEEEPAFSSLRRKIEQKVMKDEEPSSFSSSLRKRLEDRMQHDQRRALDTAAPSMKPLSRAPLRQEPSLQDIDDTNPLAFFQNAQASVKPPRVTQPANHQRVIERTKLEEDRMRLEQERVLLAEELRRDDLLRSLEHRRLGGVPENAEPAQQRGRRHLSEQPMMSSYPTSSEELEPNRRYTTSGVSPFNNYDNGPVNQPVHIQRPEEQLTRQVPQRLSWRSRRTTSAAAGAHSRQNDLRLLEEQLQRDAQLRIDQQMRQYEQATKASMTPMRIDTFETSGSSYNTGNDLDEVVYFDDESPAPSEHELDMVFNHHQFDREHHDPATGIHQPLGPAAIVASGAIRRDDHPPAYRKATEAQYPPPRGDTDNELDRQYLPPDAGDLEAVHFNDGDGGRDLEMSDSAPPPFFTPQGAPLELKFRGQRPQLDQFGDDNYEDEDEMVLFM